MNMQRVFTILAIPILTAIGGIPVAKQIEQPQLSELYLKEKQQVFIDYSKDFISFAKAHQAEGLEFQIPFDLATIADMNRERIGAAEVLLDIYENMTCEKDRVFVNSQLKQQFLYDVQGIDLDIKSVNVSLSHTTLPGVSQTAIRMKDDLREVRAKLDAYAK